MAGNVVDKVLMPFGWVPLMYTFEGSTVIAIDDVRQDYLSGICREVVDSNLVVGDVYRLVLSNGVELESFLNSRWEIRIPGHRDWSIVTLSEMLTWFPPLIPERGRSCLCSSNAYLSGRYEIRQVGYYLKFNIQDLTSLPPYWVGLLATIGCLEGNEPYVYMDRDLAQRMRDQGSWEFFLDEPRDITNDRRELRYGFKSYEYINGRSKLAIELDNLELMFKDVRDRFIHPSYIYSDFYDRVNIIQGIMDARGYVDSDTISKIRLKSKVLAENLSFLVRSLGGYAPIKEITKYREWEVSVFMPNPELPFSLPSKLAQYVEHPVVLPPLYIERIELIEEAGNRRVIELSDGGAYLNQDLIPIHGI